MMFFGVSNKSHGITVGEYRDGTDSPFILRGMNNTSGGNGTVIGFYGQTLASDNTTLKTIGYIL